MPPATDKRDRAEFLYGRKATQNIQHKLIRKEHGKIHSQQSLCTNLGGRLEQMHARRMQEVVTTQRLFFSHETPRADLCVHVRRKEEERPRRNTVASFFIAFSFKG